MNQWLPGEWRQGGIKRHKENFEDTKKSIFMFVQHGVSEVIHVKNGLNCVHF